MTKRPVIRPPISAGRIKLFLRFHFLEEGDDLISAAAEMPGKPVDRPALVPTQVCQLAQGDFGSFPLDLNLLDHGTGAILRASFSPSWFVYLRTWGTIFTVQKQPLLKSGFFIFRTSLVRFYEIFNIRGRSAGPAPNTCHSSFAGLSHGSEGLRDSSILQQETPIPAGIVLPDGHVSRPICPRCREYL